MCAVGIQKGTFQCLSIYTFFRQMCTRTDFLRKNTRAGKSTAYCFMTMSHLAGVCLKDPLIVC